MTFGSESGTGGAVNLWVLDPASGRFLPLIYVVTIMWSKQYRLTGLKSGVCHLLAE